MFSTRLNATRKAKGFTAQQMADALEMQIRGYRKYESGDVSPSLANLVRIADLLNVPTDYLLCRDEFLLALGVPVDLPPVNLPKHPTR